MNGWSTGPQEVLRSVKKGLKQNEHEAQRSGRQAGRDQLRRRSGARWRRIVPHANKRTALATIATHSRIGGVDAQRGGDECEQRWAKRLDHRPFVTDPVEQ